MDSRRSLKSRSLAIDTARLATGPSQARPALGERHKSAPLVPRAQRNTHHGPLHETTVSASTAREDARRGSDSRYVEGRTGPGAVQYTTPAEGYRFWKLVVVGHQGVGKSTFIDRALELRKPATSSTSSGWVSLRGAVHRVQMIELDLVDVEIQDDDHIAWPRCVDDSPFAAPDAVICLYNSTAKESVTGLPRLLTVLVNLSVPVQLVAFRSAPPEARGGPATAFADSVRQKLPEVSIIETEETPAQSAKKCMLIALKEAMASDDESTPGRPPTPHDTSAPAHPKSRNQTSARHERAPASLHSIPSHLKARSMSSDDEDDEDDEGSGAESDRADGNAEPSIPMAHRNPLPTFQQDPQTQISPTGPTRRSGPRATSDPQSSIPHTLESDEKDLRRRPGTSGTTDSRIHHTFFHAADDSPSDQESEPESPVDDRRAKDGSSGEHAHSFAALVDRLLQLPATKHESKFVPAFLCLYRAFATPLELLSEVIDRFALVDQREEVQFNKVAELLRYLQVVAHWTATYPGDFADPAVRELATTFVHEIEKSRVLAPAAKEIGNNLQFFAEDEDCDWAYGRSAAAASTTTATDAPNEGSHSIHSQDGRNGSIVTLDDSEDNTSDDELKEMRSSIRNSGTASTASSMLKAGPISSQSATNLVALEEAREQARRLRLVPHISLSKMQWHFFMDSPTEELARELTRIDWIRYSAIRPRDFVREAVLPGSRATVKTISTMVSHFNHVSFFIASMVLLRDKPKHRAKAVEKVMDLAWKVRQLNNYNCVNAIVAGMQNTAVTRLGQTMDLVPTETQRQFMRLNILVDANKSYATYRIAWENTASERIPLIPSLQKDLKMAMLANPTFIGTKVLWKKFEIMGNAIIGVQRSQEMPYLFPEKTQRAQEILRLFLETKVVDSADDLIDPSKELYDRSKQVEPNVSSTDFKKRFDWLRR